MNNKYRLAIHLTKNDELAAVLKRMAQGTCIGFDDLDKATAAQIAFEEVATVALQAVATRFRMHGSTSIHVEDDGKVLNVHPITATRIRP